MAATDDALFACLGSCGMIQCPRHGGSDGGTRCRDAAADQSPARSRNPAAHHKNLQLTAELGACAGCPIRPTRVADRARSSSATRRRSPARPDAPATPVAAEDTGRASSRPCRSSRSCRPISAPVRRAAASCGEAGQTEDAERITTVKPDVSGRASPAQKYRCACNGAVVTAPGPTQVIPGGRYAPEFAVGVAVAKYADHLPLERQVRMMARRA